MRACVLSRSPDGLTLLFILYTCVPEGIDEEHIPPKSCSSYKHWTFYVISRASSSGVFISAVLTAIFSRASPPRFPSTPAAASNAKNHDDAIRSRASAAKQSDDGLVVVAVVMAVAGPRGEPARTGDERGEEGVTRGVALENKDNDRRGAGGSAIYSREPTIVRRCDVRVRVCVCMYVCARYMCVCITYTCMYIIHVYV